MPLSAVEQAEKAKWALDANLLRLKNNAGEAWDNFVKSFEIYSREVTDAVTDAPPDQVLGAQGQAKAVRKLLMKFKEVK